MNSTLESVVPLAMFLLSMYFSRLSGHFLDRPETFQICLFSCNTKMEERLCLQWNDFQDNIQRAFWDMREDKYLTDVTLACKDGQQVEAHKVVLASSSPFFQKLFARNRQAHPLIYMGGVKSSDVLAILDFLYRV